MWLLIAGDPHGNQLIQGDLLTAGKVDIIGEAEVTVMDLRYLQEVLDQAVHTQLLILHPIIQEVVVLPRRAQDIVQVDQPGTPEQAATVVPVDPDQVLVTVDHQDLVQVASARLPDLPVAAAIQEAEVVAAEAVAIQDQVEALADPVALPGVVVDAGVTNFWLRVRTLKSLKV